MARRLGLALTIGTAAAIATWFARAALVADVAAGRFDGTSVSDFAQLWHAATAFRHGIDPYSVVGPGKAFDWPFPLLYPLTAVIVAVPFSLVPLPVAEALFVGIGVAALVYGLTRRTLLTPTLWLLASVAMMRVGVRAQWAPLTMAGALVPSFGFALACKPTLGLALLVAYPSKRAALWAGGFGLLTVLLWPWWPAEWLATLPSATHMSAPILRTGGPLILLALCRWRRPEARLLVALACVPQTPALYDALPLFLVVSTFAEGATLAVLTVVCSVALNVFQPYPSYVAWMTMAGRLEIPLLYLPCLIMVWRRPNAAPAGSRWHSNALAAPAQTHRDPAFS